MRCEGTEEVKDILSKLNQITSMSSDELTMPLKATLATDKDSLTKRKKFAVKIIRARDQEY